MNDPEEIQDFVVVKTGVLPSEFYHAQYMPRENRFGLVLLAMLTQAFLRVNGVAPLRAIWGGELNDGAVVLEVESARQAVPVLKREIEAAGVGLKNLVSIGYFCKSELIWRGADDQPIAPFHFDLEEFKTVVEGNVSLIRAIMRRSENGG